MKRGKDYWNVYSVFSAELQDYPYHPFIAPNHKVAINKYIRFISNRDSICAGAELHVIGSCKVNSEGIIDGSIQPLLAPLRIEFGHNIVSKVHVLSSYYALHMTDYLQRLQEIGEKLWKKNKNNK